MRAFSALLQQLAQARADAQRLQALSHWHAAAPLACRQAGLRLLAGAPQRRTLSLASLQQAAQLATGLPPWAWAASLQASADPAEAMALALPPPAEPDATTLSTWLDERAPAWKALPAPAQQQQAAAAWRQQSAAERQLLYRLLGAQFRSPLKPALLQAWAQAQGVVLPFQPRSPKALAPPPIGQPGTVRALLLYLEAGAALMATVALWSRRPHSEQELQAVVAAMARPAPAASQHVGENVLQCLPLGKASLAGLPQAALAQVQAVAARHTLQRFGPVRLLAPRLVLELRYEALSASRRHKSGLVCNDLQALAVCDDTAPLQSDVLPDVLARLSLPQQANPPGCNTMPAPASAALPNTSTT